MKPTCGRKPLVIQEIDMNRRTHTPSLMTAIFRTLKWQHPAYAAGTIFLSLGREVRKAPKGLQFRKLTMLPSIRKMLLTRKVSHQ